MYMFLAGLGLLVIVGLHQLLESRKVGSVFVCVPVNTKPFWCEKKAIQWLLLTCDGEGKKFLFRTLEVTGETRAFLKYVLNGRYSDCRAHALLLPTEVVGLEYPLITGCLCLLTDSVLTGQIFPMLSISAY